MRRFSFFLRIFTSHDVIWFNAMLIPRVVSDPIGEIFVENNRGIQTFLT